MLEELRRKVVLLYRVACDARAPWRLKLLLILIVAYVLSPIDLIPDFIPVLGLLDEVILLPILLSIAYRMVPDDLKKQYQDNSQEPTITDKRLKTMGSGLVVLVWLLLLLIMYWVYRFIVE